jgi:hypothetical protein
MICRIPSNRFPSHPKGLTGLPTLPPPEKNRPIHAKELSGMPDDICALLQRNSEPKKLADIAERKCIDRHVALDHPNEPWLVADPDSRRSSRYTAAGDAANGKKPPHPLPATGGCEHRPSLTQMCPKADPSPLHPSNRKCRGCRGPRLPPHYAKCARSGDPGSLGMALARCVLGTRECKGLASLSFARYAGWDCPDSLRTPRLAPGAIIFHPLRGLRLSGRPHIRQRRADVGHPTGSVRPARLVKGLSEGPFQRAV